MTATSHVEVVELRADSFQFELSKDPVLISYAYLFLKYLRESANQISDVMTDLSTLEDLRSLINGVQENFTVTSGYLTKI